ncbi:MAG: hypothetical protein RJA76_1562, partial [Bacteroidota bacterium]
MKNLSFEDTKIAFEAKSDFQLKKAYWIFATMNQNWLVKLGTFFIKLFLFLHFPIKKLIKVSIFQQFCGGESINDCESTIESLGKSNIGTILDYSVEGEENEKSFQKTKDEIIKTITKAKSNPHIPFAVFKLTGIFKAELLELHQAENGQLEGLDLEEFEHSKEILNEICLKAFEENVKIFIDAEESWIQNTIDELTYEMMVKFNKKQTIIFNTYQMYRVDMLDNLQNAIQTAKNQNYFLGVKLVRGAYIEKERLRAHEDEYSEPIHKEKDATDHDYDQALQLCLNHLDVVEFCIGTHNEKSCKLLCSLLEENGLAKNHPKV